MKSGFQVALVFLLLLAGCAKQPASGGQHATVTMKDGSSVAGTVVSSSPTEIQITGDDKVSRTIPMAQVRSVTYDDTPAPSASAAPAPASTPPPAAAPATSPEPVAAEAAHEDHYHPAASEVTSKTFEIPVGAEVSVRTEETIDSSNAVEGQTFAAQVTRSVRDSSGAVVIPRGANAQIVIRSASKGGRIKGASDLVLDLASISVGGQQYRVSTVDLVERGREGVGANKRTGIFAGGGAAFGAIVGAIAGGGKGAAIGAGSGAGAGAVAQILTKGTIKIPVESVLTFKLDRPLRITKAD